MTVPRAASFAVTFRVGHAAQMDLPGMSIGERVIDELLECLELFISGQNEQLKKRIPDEAYFRNFVGLASDIAPDGKDVNLVGFTTLRRGEVKKVALTSTNITPRDKVIRETTVGPSLMDAIELIDEKSVHVSGVLRLADSTTKGKDLIKLIDADAKSHIIEVPPGLMSDIVRPYWDSRVMVTGAKIGKRVILEKIVPIASE
jgi:hypothetical protein